MTQIIAMMGMSGVRTTSRPMNIAQPMASMLSSGWVREGGVTVRNGSGRTEPFDSSLSLIAVDTFAVDISLCPATPAALGGTDPSGT